MASDRDTPNVELSHILTLKDDMHSLANGESETINGGTWSSLRDPLYGGASGGGAGGRMGGARGTIRRWADSFRRDPKGRMTPKNAFVGGLGMDLGMGPGDGREHQGRNYYDLRAANYRTAHPLLAKELKGRHLQMIAIGGSIGE